MQAVGVWEQLRRWTLPAGQGRAVPAEAVAAWRHRSRGRADVAQMCPSCAAGAQPGGGGRGSSCSACAAGRRRADPARGRAAVRGLGGLLAGPGDSSGRERVPCTAGRGISVASLDPRPAGGARQRAWASLGPHRAYTEQQLAPFPATPGCVLRVRFLSLTDSISLP